MIDIVLATYNGQDFLEEQVKSIRQNSGYQKWVNQIIIADDGSTDKTKEIVANISRQDEKIQWFENSSGKKGPKFNFAFGLTKSDADYVMFCDQDDIWLPCKIEKSIKAMQKAEQQQPQGMPILVFSDKQIVDDNLNEICSSYFELKNISKNWHQKFALLCQQNVVSGCTMLFNRALIDKAQPIPKQAYMHDWWLALVASRCGHIEFIDQPLIQYRQHSQNSIGANKRSHFDLFKRFFHHLKQFESSVRDVIQQAQAFQEFEQENNLVADATIKSLVTLEQQSRYQRIKALSCKTITRSHFAGRLALLIVLLKMKQQKY